MRGVDFNNIELGLSALRARLEAEQSTHNRILESVSVGADVELTHLPRGT